MKRCVFGVCVLVVAGLFACHTGGNAPPDCRKGEAPNVQAETQKTAAEARKTATELPKPPKGEPVDNFRCHVCHINFSEDALAVNHANVGVGCEKCHGKSDAHCGDENNVTAPEIMYAKEVIVPACMACHKVLSADHKAVVEGTATKDKYCTDCHGTQHKVAVRSRAWDKQTGKLIVK